jgi:hypothetical protein
MRDPVGEADIGMQIGNGWLSADPTQPVCHGYGYRLMRGQY